MLSGGGEGGMAEREAGLGGTLFATKVWMVSAINNCWRGCRGNQIRVTFGDNKMSSARHEGMNKLVTQFKKAQNVLVSRRK